MKKQKNHRLDIIIILAIVVVGVIILLVMFIQKKSGNMVQVRVDGEIVKEFDINQDTTYEIQGVDDGTNLLVIKDGVAEVTEASCPDSLCINMGQISNVGESIVCLPNKVVVEVVSEEPDDNQQIDYIVG